VIIPDVNILIGAFRGDDPHFDVLNPWLARVVSGPEVLALTDSICAGYVRIVTHPRIFDFPTDLEEALDHVAVLRARPNTAVVGPGPRHWDVMAGLCRRAGVRGSHVSDAYRAAVAIEHGATFATLDRGFGRFPGLHWCSPLDD
jgi:toxin-antitoxin system PIN domain toxin